MNEEMSGFTKEESDLAKVYLKLRKDIAVDRYSPDSQAGGTIGTGLAHLSIGQGRGDHHPSGAMMGVVTRASNDEARIAAISDTVGFFVVVVKSFRTLVFAASEQEAATCARMAQQTLDAEVGQNKAKAFVMETFLQSVSGSTPSTAVDMFLNQSSLKHSVLVLTLAQDPLATLNKPSEIKKAAIVHMDWIATEHLLHIQNLGLALPGCRATVRVLSQSSNGVASNGSMAGGEYGRLRRS